MNAIGYVRASINDVINLFTQTIKRIFGIGDGQVQKSISKLTNNQHAINAPSLAFNTAFVESELAKTFSPEGKWGVLKELKIDPKYFSAKDIDKSLTENTASNLERTEDAEEAANLSQRLKTIDNVIQGIKTDSMEKEIRQEEEYLKKVEENLNKLKERRNKLPQTVELGVKLRKYLAEEAPRILKEETDKLNFFIDGLEKRLREGKEDLENGNILRYGRILAAQRLQPQVNDVIGEIIKDTSGIWDKPD